MRHGVGDHDQSGGETGKLRRSCRGSFARNAAVGKNVIFRRQTGTDGSHSGALALDARSASQFGQDRANPACLLDRIGNFAGWAVDNTTVGTAWITAAFFFRDRDRDRGMGIDQIAGLAPAWLRIAAGVGLVLCLRCRR